LFEKPGGRRGEEEYDSVITVSRFAVKTVGIRITREIRVAGYVL
jgi:hypothetical protein